MSEFPFCCYETFAGGYIAFERGGRFYFGPASKLDALLLGSAEDFLTGDEAQARVAELHAQQDYSAHSKQHPESEYLLAIREEWEKERRNGQWAKGAN
jgi:hypothetical protein